MWDVVPHPGEVFFYDVPADYERYYGQDVSYSQSGGFFFGHPAFVLAGLAVSAISNAARRMPPRPRPQRSGGSSSPSAS